LKLSWSLEEIFVIVFTVVDDSYKKLFGSPGYFRTSPNDEPAFTDSELITLALVAAAGSLQVSSLLVEICQQELSLLVSPPL